MKCHIMQRNSVDVNHQIIHMPLYNRSHTYNKHRGDEDIALSTHKKQKFLEKEIKFDDTLQSVALEFDVPVAELKRINNIHKDNEIYARKVIKVPSNPLTILLDKEYFPGNETAPEKQNRVNCDIIVATVNNCNAISKNCCESLAEKQENFTCSPVATDELQESELLLNPPVEHKSSDVMHCSGADWGISWHILLIVILVLGLGCPFLYLFWLIWSKKGKAEGS